MIPASKFEELVGDKEKISGFLKYNHLTKELDVRDMLMSFDAPETHPGKKVSQSRTPGLHPSVRQANAALADQAGISQMTTVRNYYPYTWQEWGNAALVACGMPPAFPEAFAEASFVTAKSSIKTGYQCTRCGEFNEYAAANQPNGSYICSYHSKY